MVLKGVKYCRMGNGLEMSQFALISKIPPEWSWKEFKHIVLKACLALALVDLSSLYDVQGVKFPSIVPESHVYESFVNVMGSDESWFRLVSFPAFR